MVRIGHKFPSHSSEGSAPEIRCYRCRKDLRAIDYPNGWPQQRLNDAWCDCFHRNRILVGISVDGPKDIHNAHRRFRNG